MADLQVDLVTPTGMMLEGTLLPDNMLTEEVISELIDELNLPRLSSGGKVISYVLELVGSGQRLAAGQTLRDVGVTNGDRIRLASSEGTKSTVPPPVRRPVAGPLADPTSDTAGSEGTIEVVLSVLDVNKNERSHLPTDRPVGELIQQIASNFNLPSRDKLNEPITYRIESKALGRYLANRETLHQAGIPRLDRLSIHREEHAGCCPAPARLPTA